MGQGHQGRFREYQRQGRRHRDQAGVPSSLRAPSLPGAGQQLFEWKKTEAGKQPYAIALADRGIMALAGLSENWKSLAGE
jgi:hypothetical protein